MEGDQTYPEKLLALVLGQNPVAGLVVFPVDAGCLGIERHCDDERGDTCPGCEKS